MASETRERMLETTARLLRHRGYHGTALSDILEESGAPRGSLYFHFPGGKDQLALEATRAAVDETTRALVAALAGAPDAARGVRRYFEAAAELVRASDYTFGCPVAPVILDGAGGAAELAALCREALVTWIEMLRRAFVAGGVPRPRAAALALLVSSTLEGGLLVSRAYRDAAPLATLGAEMERLIAAALPARRRR